MKTRRTLLGLGGLGLINGLVSACGGGGGGSGGLPTPFPMPMPSPAPAPSPSPETAWRMPDEGGAHRAVWMAFAARESIWTAEMRQPVHQALARIANAISVYEPVKMLVNPADAATARQLCGSNVQLIEHPIDDLWMRDTGCVFVRNARGERAAVSFNFNGWGNQQAHARDATVAARMAELAGVPLLRSTLVLEGGGIEVDGQGTAIITESCVLNKNRNPGVSKAEAEKELKRVLGLEKIIWLPGIAGRDITDGHTDFYARFIKPGVVVAALETNPESFDHAVTRRHLELLNVATDASGRALQVITLQTPGQVRPAFARKDFAAGYVNFLLTDKAVFLPEFGDAVADQAARTALAAQLPSHQIVQLDIDAIAAGGGGIHCTTQQEPV
ncbi:agmatine deiminase family protein [Variovorax sp. KBW07]|uniref:agmatine deiminase family protein n=1 Tax=Variovorax sp. KBW07 TaxID=2153358 RepID=UPI00288A0A46|nr:agmatine deiminase family protein [Variovorax sp. KBW07]